MTRILVVDDDVDILELLRLEFEEEGCSTDTTPDAKIALDLARRHTYDLIVTDWRMPVMNGTEFVGSLRRQGCRSCIILYSGMDRDQGIKDALDAGADYFISRRGDPFREFAGLKEIVGRCALAGTTGDRKAPADPVREDTAR